MDSTIYTAQEVHTSRIMSFLLLIFSLICSNHFRQRLFWCAAPLSQRPTYSTSLLGEAPFWKKPYAHLTEEKGSKAIRAMPIYTDHISKRRFPNNNLFLRYVHLQSIAETYQNSWWVQTSVFATRSTQIFSDFLSQWMNFLESKLAGVLLDVCYSHLIN